MRRRTIKKTLSIVLTAAMIGTTYIPVAAEETRDAQVTENEVDNIQNNKAGASTAEENGTSDAVTVTASQTADAQEEETTGAEGTAVAKIDGQSYATIQEAVSAATEGQTVTLTADAAEDVTIPAGKNIVLDLNGKTLTNTNAGKATVSVAGTAYVKNGKVIGGTSYYNIEVVKDGTATLEDVTATAGNTGSSMIDVWGTLTIKSGTYTGGLNVVKNEEIGNVTIEDGSFELSYAKKWNHNSVILNYAQLTINDGYFHQKATQAQSYPHAVMNGVVDGYDDPSTVINGGTFQNDSKVTQARIFWALGNAKLTSFSVKGGTFNKAVQDDCIASGYELTKSGSTYTVEKSAEASVNGQKYKELKDAIDVAKDGETVTLLQDIESYENWIYLNNGKDIAIDLNGHDITFAGSYGIYIYGGKIDLTGKGTICAPNATATLYMVGSSTDVADFSVANVGKDVTLVNNTYYGMGLGYRDANSHAAYGVKLTLDGKVVAPYGYTLSGTITQQTGNIPEITINGEIESTSATDSGSFYAAGYAKYNINGKLTGVESALEIRAGILNIGENAVLTATGDFEDPMPNGSGSTVKGVALAISQHTTNLPIEVNVAGGTFKTTGNGGYSLYEIDTEEKGNTYSENVLVNVTGGTFNQPIFSANKKFAISGGTFSKAVDPDYCAIGYAPETTPNADGKYGVTTKDVMEATTTVSGSTSTATIGGKYSGKETDDVNNVATKEGTVIVDVTGESTADVTTSEIKVDKNSLSSLNNNKDVQKIIIQADAGTLDINKEALAKMTTDAKDSDVVLKLVKDQKDSGELYYHVTATANGEEIYTVNDPAGEVTISVSYEKTTNCEPIVYYVNNEGTREKVTSAYDSTNKTLSWKTSHFSDYQITSGESATITVGEKTSTYETLEAAIAAATDGQTITLINDVNESGLSITADKNITINLNGYTWTSEKSVRVDGGQLTVVDSTATNPTVEGAVVTGYTGGKITSANTTVAVINGGSLTIESGLIESTGNCGVYANGNQTPGTDNTGEVVSTVVMKGGYVHSIEYGIGVAGRGATLTVNGGVIEAEDNAAVAGNGTNSATRYDGGTTINITGGNLVGHITSKGYIACGIYHPQKGTLNISGGTIYADKGVGILMRGGSMNMTGGEVIASGNASGKVGDANIIAQCYGIYIDGSAGYYGAKEDDFATEITGGSVTASADVPALNLSNKADNTTKGTITVKAAEDGTTPTFSSTIDDSYCENNGQAEGYYPVQDSEGNYTVDNTISTEFLGGSLKKDTTDYTKAHMRFGYSLTIPEGATWKWNYGTNKDNLSKSVTGVNYIQKNGYKVSNIVVINIPAKHYKTPIYSQLVVTYKTETGKEYTYTDSIQERTVEYVANGIAADTENETDDSIAYAKKILEQIGNN